jgi:hypothetical protein
MMGNRGILHDDVRRIVRPWQVRRWIACVLEFRGRRRSVMQPRRYTELFFLDEATALAAGHRPCAECRNAEYKRFRSIWEEHFGERAGADAMDDRLHADRLEGKRKRTYRAQLGSLPDGTYVALDATPWLVWDSKLYTWSDSGYSASRPRHTRIEVEVLTPRALAAILGAGYRPTIHPSAG